MWRCTLPYPSSLLFFPLLHVSMHPPPCDTVPSPLTAPCSSPHCPMCLSTHPMWCCRVPPMLFSPRSHVSVHPPPCDAVESPLPAPMLFSPLSHVSVHPPPCDAVPSPLPAPCSPHYPIMCLCSVHPPPGDPALPALTRDAEEEEVVWLDKLPVSSFSEDRPAIEAGAESGRSSPHLARNALSRSM